MEPFYVEDKFYSEIEDYLIDVELEKEDIEKLPDDYKVDVLVGSLEKIFVLKKDRVVDAIVDMTDTWEERFPEDSHDVFEKIKKAISESIDIDKMNSLLPSLYYPTGEDGVITKQDLLAAC